MGRGRFVVRYRGEGPVPDADLERVRGLAGVEVLDVSPRMVLVAADEDRLRQLVDSLGGWELAPEVSYTVPDVRKQVRRPPT